jgi:hypothetical protein
MTCPRPSSVAYGHGKERTHGTRVLIVMEGAAVSGPHFDGTELQTAVTSPAPVLLLRAGLRCPRVRLILQYVMYVRGR